MGNWIINHRCAHVNVVKEMNKFRIEVDVRTALYNITPLLRTIVSDGQICAAFGYFL